MQRSQSPGGSSAESDGKEQKPVDKEAQLQQLNPAGVTDPGQMMNMIQEMLQSSGGALGIGGSKSMDRQEKRKLITEIKEELKDFITSISDYQVEQAVTIVKTQLRKLESDNELDKKRIVENFETKIGNLTEYFNQKVREVRKDFAEDMRNLQKLIHRHKSDADVRAENHDSRIILNTDDIAKHKTYFSTIA